MATIALTEPQRRYLVSMLKVGRGSLVAIDRALLDERRRRVRRELVADRARIAADVERLEAVLING